MSNNYAELRTRLAAIQAAHDSGVKSVTIDGTTTQYSSLAEMQRIVASLKKRLPEHKYARPMSFKAKMG